MSELATTPVLPGYEISPEDAGTEFEMQSLRLPTDGTAYRVAKRGFDLLVSIALLPVGICIALAVALLVKISSPGPLLYRHTRIGRDGKPFQLLKFRTMRHHSDFLLHDLLDRSAEARHEWLHYRKLRNDPRVTKIGALLRRTNLDEVPQLLNVLRGQMSLVGPRPIVQEELLRYGGGGTLYRAVRPGITGLWQVSGRGRLKYERRVALDVEYVSTWTLTGDLLVLFRTLGAFGKSHGAF